MFNIGKSTLYLGNSLTELNQIRDLLEQNDIEYKYKIISHEEAMTAPGRGVGRSVSGINSTNSNDKLYEVLVSSKDLEKAQMLLHQRN